MKNNQSLKEQQKIEAICRLKKLGVPNETINLFEQGTIIKTSNDTSSLSSLNKNEIKILKQFEKDYNSMIYHVVHAKIMNCSTLSFIYVSPHQEEWSYDFEELIEGCTLAYVYNKSLPSLSEIGGIGIENRNGCLIRTY